MSKTRISGQNLPQKGTIKPTGKKSEVQSGSDNFFKKKGFYLLLSLILIISGIVYFDFITFKNLFIYKGIGSDTYNQFVPSLVHFTNYLRTDGIPRWSFNQGIGQNIFPGSINNPFRLFLYLFDGNHLVYALAYAQLLKIFIGGIIFYKYLKLIGISPFASLVGALLFSFSGYMILGGCWYGHSSLVVFGAFLLFAFEKLYKQNSWIYFPIAVAILSTEFFKLYLFGFFLLLYALLRFYQENEFKDKRIIGLLLKMSGLGVLGVGINTVFLISPTLQMINSPRVSGNAGYFHTLVSKAVFDFASAKEYMTAILRSYSSDLLGTGDTYKGWSNYLEGPIFYIGVLNLLLVPQVFQFLNRKTKILFGGFIGFWFLLILFPFFRNAFYLFSGNYYKAGLSFFVPVSLLYMGITALSNIDRLNKINGRVLAISWAILTLLLFIPYVPKTQNLLNLNLRIAIVLLLCLYSVLILLLKYPKSKFAAQLLLLIVMAVELSSFSYITVNKRNVQITSQYKERVGYNDYTIEAVNYLKSIDKSFFRIHKAYSSGDSKYDSMNDAMIQDYYSTPSYQSFNQLSYIKFLDATEVLDEENELQTRWISGIQSNKPRLQTLTNIKYILTKSYRPDFAAVGKDSLTTINGVSIFKNRFYLPMGFTYDRYIYESDLSKTSKKGISLMQAFTINQNQTELFKDFTYDSMIDTTSNFSIEEYKRFDNELRKDTLEMTEHSQNHFIGKIKLEKKKLLYFSIPFDDGWKARVDGRPANLQLVNFGFMGIILDKGVHDVIVYFEPPYLYEGIWISGISLLLYGTLLFFNFKKKNTLTINS